MKQRTLELPGPALWPPLPTLPFSPVSLSRPRCRLFPPPSSTFHRFPPRSRQRRTRPQLAFFPTALPFVFRSEIPVLSFSRRVRTTPWVPPEVRLVVYVKRHMFAVDLYGFYPLFGIRRDFVVFFHLVWDYAQVAPRVFLWSPPAALAQRISGNRVCIFFFGDGVFFPLNPTFSCPYPRFFGRIRLLLRTCLLRLFADAL